jgi:hypothetical protein
MSRSRSRSTASTSNYYVPLSEVENASFEENLSLVRAPLRESKRFAITINPRHYTNGKLLTHEAIRDWFFPNGLLTQALVGVCVIGYQSLHIQSVYVAGYRFEIYVEMLVSQIVLFLFLFFYFFILLFS